MNNSNNQGLDLEQKLQEMYKRLSESKGEFQKKVGEITQKVGEAAGIIEEAMKNIEETAKVFEKDYLPVEKKTQEINEELKNKIRELNNQLSDQKIKHEKKILEQEGKYENKLSKQKEEHKKELLEQEGKYEDKLSKQQEEYKKELKNYQEDLGQCQKDLEICKKNYDGVNSDKKRMESELTKNSEEINRLNEKIKQHVSKEEKMQAVMQLYDAYSSMAEKRNTLPPKFFDCLKRIVPSEDFEGFLQEVLTSTPSSFPIRYYQAVPSVIMGDDISGEEWKEVLKVSEDLLSAVFEFGKKRFEEEGLERINIGAGENMFDGNLCTYVDRKGSGYEITKVWLRGFRDKKKNIIYRSYVEGEK